MDLRELQATLGARFAKEDKARALPFLVDVLQEEVSELARAVREGDPKVAGREAVDVLFVALSVCNALGTDAEDKLREKYLDRHRNASDSWRDLGKPGKP